MIRLVVLALAFLAGFCSASERIVGGTPTTVEQYPTIVQVDRFDTDWNVWFQSCGANILNNLYVLSAAHCFHGDLYRREGTRIRAGATFRNTGGVLVYIIREYNHPSYLADARLGLDGDITVVRLASPLVFTNVIQPTSIPAQGSVIPDNLPVVHAGWGITSFPGISSSVLLDVQIYTVNNNICRQRYEYLDQNRGIFVVTPNMICAGVLDVGGRDACTGDSGGPLYWNTVTVGIVSWGHGCANDTYPGVSAAVSPYTNWIVQIASQ